MRQGDIQEILMHLLFELTMKEVMLIRARYPGLEDSEVIAMMVRDAYKKASPECLEHIHSLTYDETVYLELQMQIMAHKSIRYHDDLLQILSRNGDVK